MITSAQTPTFEETLASGIYGLGESLPALNGTASVTDGGTVTYQWQSSSNGSSWSNLAGETGPTFTPPSNTVGTVYYRVIATNTNGYPDGLTPLETLYPAEDLYPVDVNTVYTAQVQSNTATIQIAEAEIPVFKKPLVSANYNKGNPASPLDGTATAPDGIISYQWQYSDNLQNWNNLPGETNATYTPPTNTAGVKYYRVIATNTVGSTQKSATSTTASIEVFGAEAPVFNALLQSAFYNSGDSASELNGTATASHGTITYQWYADGQAISGATNATYTPPTTEVGVKQYYVTATNTVGTDVYSVQSNTATITVYGATKPEFIETLNGAEYDIGNPAIELNGTAIAERGTISYQWYANGAPIFEANGPTYTPPTSQAGSTAYSVTATNTVGTSQKTNTQGPVTVTVYAAQTPVFQNQPESAEYNAGDPAESLDGTASAERGSITYQWYADGEAISGAVSAQYTPPTQTAGETSYYVIATNIVGTTQESAQSETATVTVYGASVPVFTETPASADYIQNDVAAPLTAQATAERGTVEIFWQVLNGNNWNIIPGETGNSYTPPTQTAGTFQYRAMAVNTVGISTAENFSEAALVTVIAAQSPVFANALISGVYNYAAPAAALNGTASVTDGGTITYQWYQKGPGDQGFSAISGATAATYVPKTLKIGQSAYYVIATNTLHNSSAFTQSTTALITVIETRATASEKWEMYLTEIRQPFQKLVRLDFLQPDGSVAFSLDNNPKNKRSGAFIQDGNLDVNLQNGQRRKASVLLSNLNWDYEFAINKIWFGQQIRLMEGILLSNGEEFYLPQGVFYVSDPLEAFHPNQKYVQYNLLDKWAYLDGTLFGNLEGIYEVPLNTNIFTAISSILELDRGNGYPVDNVPPIFSDYWNEKTVTLESGETISVLLTPYTYRCDSTGGCYANILLEMNTMLVGWIGYDQTGHLRLDAGDDDILDTEKPVLWTFSPTEKNFLGATYSPKITQVYNDIIIVGQALDNNPTPAGRATNMDPRSDTNIYSSLGRRTLRKDATAYYATEQCQEYACYTMKRNTIIKKSVSISSSQMFHLTENCLVQVRRPDKQGAPTERHLVTGFSRSLTGTENMTINCTSVQDFPEATLTALPGNEN